MAAREYTSARSQATRPELPAGPMPDPATSPAQAMLGWVAQDPARAREVLAAEQARQEPRRGLVDALELLLPHFRLDGVRWVLAVDHVSVLDVTDLARMAHVDAGSLEGAAALGEFYETVLGRPAYLRFKRHCREHRTDDEMLLEIMGGVVEELTGRPTQPPSESPPGPGITLGQSRVVSSDGSQRPMTQEEFEAWRAQQDAIEQRAQQLLAQRMAPPTPPGFASS